MGTQKIFGDLYWASISSRMGNIDPVEMAYTVFPKINGNSVSVVTWYGEVHAVRGRAESSDLLMKSRLKRMKWQNDIVFPK